MDIADICSSPQLFAAYHVLLRLLVPRHSPYALSSLTSLNPKTLATSFFLVYLIFFIYIFFNVLLVGSNGIEPSTSRLSGVRSNHLSYEPINLINNDVLLKMFNINTHG